jgi:hypothetical protein
MGLEMGTVLATGHRVLHSIYFDNRLYQEGVDSGYKTRGLLRGLNVSEAIFSWKRK